MEASLSTLSSRAKSRDLQFFPYRSTRVSLVTMSRRVLVNSNPRNDKALVVEGKRATSAAILRCMLNQGGCGFLQPM